MPDENKILVIRPRDCRYCGNGYYALAHAIEQIKNLSLNPNLEVIDLAAEDAEKEPVLNALEEHDPYLIISFGHGYSSAYTGNSETPIFDTNNIYLLAGRIWKTLSCQVGKLLGLQMVREGGIAFLGYDEDWVWLALDSSADPYEDKHAKAFYISDNQGSIVLGVTYDPSKASDEAIKEYNRWIDYWLENPEEDPKAVEIVKWLIWDRDALVLYLYGYEEIRLPSPLLPIAVMSLPVMLGIAISQWKPPKEIGK